MIRIEFTEEAIEKLRYERFHHPHPRVQRKMEALLLKSDGCPSGLHCAPVTASVCPRRVKIFRPIAGVPYVGIAAKLRQLTEP